MSQSDLPEEGGGFSANGPARPGKLHRTVILHSCLSVVLLSVVILLVVLMWLSGWNVDKIRNNLVQGWADRLWKVNMEESFRAETLRIASTNGNELTLVTHERREVFERTTVGIVPLLNRAVPFTDRKTTVAFPATYRYHILLNDPWGLETRGTTVVVHAPALRPTLPVAFDSGQVDTATKGWWVSGAWAETDKDALIGRITEKLAQQAGTPEMIDAVRDSCRDSLAKFVKAWLLKEDHWKAGQFTEIKVLFPGEDPGSLDTMEPSLRLEEPPELPMP